MADRRIEYMPLGSIQGAEVNPKDHDIGVLSQSVGRFGYAEAVMLDERSQRLVAGHGRVETLKALKRRGGAAPAGVDDRNGEWFIPVQRGWASRDDAEARAYLIASNRTVELGGWHSKELDALLLELHAGGQDALIGTGYGADDIAELLDAARDGSRDDDAPDLSPKPWVKPGDRFALGDHLLTCGDSTKPETLAGDLATCMWTDPPYGVEYVGKTKAKKTIANDGAEGLPALLTGAFAAATAALRPGAAVYVAHASAKTSEFVNAFLGGGWRLHQQLVWVKDSMVLGHSDYHYQHEPILYGYTAGGGRRGRGGEGWFGGADQRSVFEVPRPRRSEAHPTMKPVELIVQMLRNSSERGDWVLEPFGGSGSTLIACEVLGRRCRAAELSPGYAQVIVERWQKFTGRKAKKL